MTPYRALIFDFDGTILDTERADFTSWQEIFREYDCDFPLAAWTAAIGGSGDRFDPYAYLESQIGRPVDRDAIRSRRRGRNLELIEAERVLPGVTEYIGAARELGLRLGIASSSPRSWVAGHLARVGLLARFECIRCADDVARVKPDPEVYRATLAALAVSGDQALAVEDSLNGMLAAREAGIACVVVPNAMMRGIRFDGADLRLESLADLPLQTLLQRLGDRHPSGKTPSPGAVPPSPDDDFAER